MFAGRGVRLVIQAAYFILIARALGVENYGAFVAALALVSILAPFATLGSGNLLVMHVSRDRSRFPDYWGRALLVTLVSSAFLMVLVAVISRFALPPSMPIAMVLTIALADLFFYRLIDLSGQAFQSVERLQLMATLQVTVSLSRLVGAVILATLVRNPTVENWSMLYMATTAAASLASLYAVSRSLGMPAFSFSLDRAELRQGAYFSISLSAQSVYNDLDKTMLARLSTLEATGIYGIAYRLIDVAFTPVVAVLSATYASFFRHGAAGIGASAKFARRILPNAGAYGALVGIALFVLAPKLPLILGEEYAPAVEAIRWLAPIPLLRSMHYLVSDAITGAGHQGFRSAAQFGVAILNFLLNLWLLPLYGWRGAAWASLASDTVLLLSTGSILWYLTRRDSRNMHPVAA